MRENADIPLSRLELNSYGWKDRAEIYSAVKLGILRGVDRSLPVEARRKNWIRELQRVRLMGVDFRYLRRVKCFIVRIIGKDINTVVLTTIEAVEEFLDSNKARSAKVLAVFGSNKVKKHLNPAIKFSVVHNDDLDTYVWVGRERTTMRHEVLQEFWGQQ